MAHFLCVYKLKELIMSIGNCECCSKENVELKEFSKEWEVYGSCSLYSFMFCQDCMEDKENMFMELMKEY